MVKQICVIGGGVIGLSTAVNIQKCVQDAEVTVIAEEFTPNTTGDVAAGLWEPSSLVGGTPLERLRKWCRASFQHFSDLARSPEGGKLGAFFVSGFSLMRSPQPLPMYHAIVPSHRSMTPEELAQFPGYSHGYAFTTAILECRYYLPELIKSIKENGGRLIQKKITNLSEVSDSYEVIVNCTGTGAKTLVGDDKVVPISGQGIRVYAPWLKHFAFAKDDAVCILPCSDTVLLGNTRKVGDWSTTVDEAEKRRVIEECCKLMPSLKGAKEIGTSVGLRPSRTEVRLEAELIPCGSKLLKVVHNYGHGGGGVTLHWGCAIEAAELVQKFLADGPNSKL